MMQACKVELKQLSTDLQPLQLTSLANFAGQSRQVIAAPLARQIASERTGGLKRRAVLSEGSSPQHRLQESGSPRSASSVAQDGQQEAFLAPDGIVNGTADQSLLLATALSLLGREPYILREELDSGGGLIQSSPEATMPAAGAHQQHTKLEAALMRGPSLVLKTHVLQEQGRWYDSWQPELARQPWQADWGNGAAGAAAEPSGSSRWEELIESAGAGLGRRNAAREDDHRRRGAAFPPRAWGMRAGIAAKKQRGAHAAALDEAAEMLLVPHEQQRGSFPAAAAAAPARPLPAEESAPVSSGPASTARRAGEGPRPVPPSKGDVVELVCQSLAFGGKGVCKLGGFTIFCSRALPGEVLRARILSTKKSHALAEKVDTLVPHNDAVPAPCAHYGQGCGGCAMQDLAYAAQLKAKHRQVVDVLQRIGRVADASACVRPIQACAKPWRYRNKMTFTFSPQSMEPSPAGFGLHAVDNPGKVVPIWDCQLQDEGANHILRLLNAAVRTRERGGDLPKVDQARAQGALQRATIRSGLNPETGERGYLVILHTKAGTRARGWPKPSPRSSSTDYHRWLSGEGTLDNAPRPPRAKAGPLQHSACPEGLRALVDALVEEVDGLVGVVHQPELEWKPRLLWGGRLLAERLCGLQFLVSPLSFFQTHPAQTEKLYQAIAEALGDGGEGGGEGHPSGGVLLDLYSGTGTIALSLAPRFRLVFGVESEEGAVQDARANATHNDVANAHFLRADLATPEGVAAVAARVPRPDAVVADPARAGLGAPALAYLQKCGACKIVYVSCNPATQARDLAALCGAGSVTLGEGGDKEGNAAGDRPVAYELEYVQPIDMFPHTEHVESIAVLRRRA